MTTTPPAGRGPKAAAGRTSSDIWIRIVSALVMAPIAIALTWAGVWPFAVLVAVAGAVVSWEWGRLVRGMVSADAAMIAQAVAIAGAVVLTAAGQPHLGLGALAIGFLAVTWLADRDQWSMGGVFYFGLPAVALVFLRSDPAYGAVAILYLFAVVWCADTAAYVSGRMIGGPKLAPRISPKKTWAGFAGAVIVPALLTLAAASWVGETGALPLAGVSLVLAAISQLGDLVESAAKRAFGVKDVSGLIPGHGGLMDRIDALLFASVAAGALAALRDAAHPGQALVIWP